MKRAAPLTVRHAAAALGCANGAARTNACERPSPVRFFHVALAAAATLAAASTPVQATRAAADDEVLEEVIVVAKRRTLIRHAAATVTVFDREHIESTLSDDIRDLIRYEPGVSVRNDPIRFGLDSFTMRGVGGDRIAVEVDGVSAAESFSVGALADSGRVFTDLDFIERVEILRGPASALYGSDAIGGVVRFQTIDPGDLLAGEQAYASRVRTGYRGDTDGWSASALTARSGRGADVLLGYSHRENNETDIARGAEPNPRDSRSDQALAKLVLPNIGAGPVEIAVEAGRVRDATIVNALLGTAPRFLNTVAMRGEDTAEHARVSIEQTLALRTAWLDEAVWRIHAQSTKTEQITNERRRAAPPRTPATELQRVFGLEDEAIGAEFTGSKALDVGGWRHQVVYGLEIDAGRVTEQRDGYGRNLESGVVSPAILGEVFPLRDFPVTDRLEAGVYLQDELQLGGGRWRITPGLRFDVFRLRPREDRIYLEDNPNARPVALDEHALAPKLAVANQVSDSTTLYGQYARGFRSPPFEDVNIGLDIPLFNYRALPNPELKPETSDSFELGVRTHARGWRATLGAHYSEFRDLIESRVNLGRDPVSGATLFQSRNVERARVYGVELASEVDAAAIAPRFAGWSVGFNAAWSRGEDISASQPLNSIDPLKAVLTIDYDAPSRWGARVAATAVGSKDRVSAAPEPLFRTDSYLALDLFAYLELGAHGSLDIGVSNLTDERYIEWIDVRGRTADDPLVVYAVRPGRSVSAAVRWKF